VAMVYVMIKLTEYIQYSIFENWRYWMDNR